MLNKNTHFIKFFKIITGAKILGFLGFMELLENKLLMN